MKNKESLAYRIGRALGLVLILCLSTCIAGAAIITTAKILLEMLMWLLK